MGSTRSRMAWSLLPASLGLASFACGSSEGPVLSGTGPGGDDGGAQFLPNGDPSASGALDAHIEENHVAVKLITLSCSGDCALVQAVGTGGHPPYTFAWDDGTTAATRQLCPTANTTYSVNVTDTGETSEVPRPSETARASVTADVLECPDGGSSNGDGGATGCQTILSSSLSGTTGPGAQLCTTSVSTSAAYSSTVTLQMGQEYELVQNAMGTLIGSVDPVWQFYASPTDCNSPPSGQSLGSLTFDPNVPRSSICFRASADYTNLTWYSTNVEEAGGLISSSYQLCQGCGQ
jgi:hypothetical protein